MVEEIDKLTFQIERYSTPFDLGEEKMEEFYRRELTPFLRELNLTLVPGVDGLPYRGYPIAALGKNETIILNPYITQGVAGRPSTLDVIFVSKEKSSLAKIVTEKFTILEPAKEPELCQGGRFP